MVLSVVAVEPVDARKDERFGSRRTQRTEDEPADVLSHVAGRSRQEDVAEQRAGCECRNHALLVVSKRWWC